MSSSDECTELPDGTLDRDSATWLKKFVEEILLETIADMVAEKLKKSLPNPISLPPSDASGKGKDCYSCLGGCSSPRAGSLYH